MLFDIKLNFCFSENFCFSDKIGNPVRPIVSACDSPPVRLSWLLNQLLKQCQRYIPTRIVDSVSFLRSFRAKYPYLDESWFLFSFDVKSMYTNIPIDECGLEILAFVNLPTCLGRGPCGREFFQLRSPLVSVLHLQA